MANDLPAGYEGYKTALDVANMANCTPTAVSRRLSRPGGKRKYGAVKLTVDRSGAKGGYTAYALARPREMWAISPAGAEKLAQEIREAKEHGQRKESVGQTRGRGRLSRSGAGPG